MRIAEAILFLFTILSHLSFSWFIPAAGPASIVFTTLLLILYFPLAVFLFKDEASMRRWQPLSLLSGFGFSLAIMGSWLKYMFWSTSSNLLVTALFCCLLALIISGLFLFSNDQKRRVSLPYYRAVFYRAVLYTLLSLAFLGADRESLINLKYGGHPDYALLLRKHLQHPDNETLKTELNTLYRQKVASKDEKR